MVEKNKTNLVESNFHSLDLKLRKDKQALQCIILQVFGKQLAEILFRNFFSQNKPHGGHQRDVDEVHTIQAFVKVMNDFKLNNFGIVNGQKRLASGYTIDKIGRVQAKFMETRWWSFLQICQAEFGGLEDIIKPESVVESETNIN
ncbi:MAG: hypothetical protein OHK0017_00860 [Patescibacteria group bacterium]